ncbi:DUF3887 domain-containing protein [Lentzea sp. NPDC005914]|uniref:DUF3887 domain-containing protein n=1 Tax=Lentzea sp. NPDC005914 TaxID=3154572 RepID=UPI0033DC89F8
MDLAGLIRHNADLVVRALSNEAPAREALVAALSLSALTEDATRALVVLARDGGATWAEIGDLLHVSRQAAQQRFGGAEMTESTVAGVKQAQQVVAHLDNGEFAAVHAMFDPLMSSKLSSDELAAVWRQLVSNLGELRNTGPGTPAKKGGYTIVDVPLTFAEAEMKARVTFNTDGSIGGLFILGLE